jgi:2-methylcitrate dehydratase PrpD
MSEHKAPLLANATRDLARFGATLAFGQVPAEAVERIKWSVLDALGCCLFGATLPWTQKVAALADAEGARPVASLFGMGRKSSASLAALVNSTAGHAFELDDIHKESILHPNSIATRLRSRSRKSRGADPART